MVEHDEVVVIVELCTGSILVVLIGTSEVVGLHSDFVQGSVVVVVYPSSDVVVHDEVVVIVEL